MVKQNLFLCLLLSALAGIFTIAGKIVVLQLARRRKALASGTSPSGSKHQHSEDEKASRRSKTRATYMMMTCFVIANIIANSFIFIAPWFGPVSVYWPAYVASQLLANMLIVGTWLQHEKFDKSAQIATLMVVAAVLYITVNGPQQSEQQDIKELLKGNWAGIAWLGLLCLVFLSSFLYMMTFLISACCGRRQNKSSKSHDAFATTSGRNGISSPAVLEGVLFSVSTTCSALSATASKAASTLNADDVDVKTTLIVITWVIIICWSVENYLEGRYVRSLGRFLPLVTLGSILLNAATGLIVWRDAPVVQSWAGYATALSLLGMGVYLISDLDFFKAQIQEQQDYQRQIESWNDLFATLEEDIQRAQVEQSLSRHQRLMNSDHCRLGLVRGNSDPELGTRTSGHEFILRESSHSSTKSKASVTHQGKVAANVPRPRSSGSASVASFASLRSARTANSRPRIQRNSTMDSLDRLRASITSFREHQEGNGQPIGMRRRASDFSFSRHTSDTTHTRSDISSYHSRDSSLWSLDGDEDMDQEYGVFTVLDRDTDVKDGVPPPPPPPSTPSRVLRASPPSAMASSRRVRRASMSPYYRHSRSRKTRNSSHSLVPLSVDATTTKTAPSPKFRPRSLSRDSSGEFDFFAQADEAHPPLEEADEQSSSDDDDAKESHQENSFMTILPPPPLKRRITPKQVVPLPPPP